MDQGVEMTDASSPGARATVRPVVYSIDAGLPFVDTLARGLVERFGKAPADLSRVTVLLPTRRAVRALREAFLRASGGEPMLLPLMRPIGDVEEEELAIETAAGIADGADSALSIPSAVPELKRQLLLANLILKWGKRRGAGTGNAAQAATGDTAQAGRLAAELARLLDQVQTERLSFDALGGLVPEDYARHWQLTLDFLRILSEHWPAILAERGIAGAGMIFRGTRAACAPSADGKRAMLTAENIAALRRAAYRSQNRRADGPWAVGGLLYADRYGTGAGALPRRGPQVFEGAARGGG